MRVNVWKAAMIALILAVVVALLLLEMRASQAGTEGRTVGRVGVQAGEKSPTPSLPVVFP